MKERKKFHFQTSFVIITFTSVIVVQKCADYENIFSDSESCLQTISSTDVHH